ncbi:chaperone modulator CbpM [Paludisphaera mucosa]|uniref:Chaperone modulator CbpM n=1 Tax=Paludisphaera mucosa TaxID=3030827 RepID=A0ABT6F8D5_9BACT|nr:chaperone modulator CbpM [Paludisphaera mucosa]MDG3003794.1 chaperone modulator CbpM [Paludisphaera mucosa]
MNERIIPRESVARHLSISPQVLVRYERLGLVRCIQEGDVEGYEPAQVRRIWSIMTYQRDLGVNLAGVEVILRLRDRMSHLHHHLSDLAAELQSLVDAPDSPDRPS